MEFMLIYICVMTRVGEKLYKKGEFSCGGIWLKVGYILDSQTCEMIGSATQ